MLVDQCFTTKLKILTFPFGIIMLRYNAYFNRDHEWLKADYKPDSPTHPPILIEVYVSES